MTASNIDLSEYLNRELIGNTLDVNDLHEIIDAIAESTKKIAENTRMTGIKNIGGSTDKINVQGEEVQILDEIANDILISILSQCSSCAGYASEELESPKMFNPQSRFLVVADPLDGSSNIDVNMPIGTIFGIIRNTDYGESSFNKSGRYYVGAGYSLYGPSDIFVIAINNKVSEFTLDPETKKYLLTRENIQVPKFGSTYSINEGNFSMWESSVKKWVLEKKNPRGTSKKHHKLRYVGSLVADAHRTLLNGGIFAYPSDKSNPKGKLRLMYEANPFALIFESAGGYAFDLSSEILDINPESFHQRTPLILGSKEDVEEFLEFMLIKQGSRKENTEITPIFSWGSESIKILRQNLYLSRSNFGKMVGVTRGTVFRWEKGVRHPNHSNKKSLDNIFVSTQKKLIPNPIKKTHPPN